MLANAILGYFSCAFIIRLRRLNYTSASWIRSKNWQRLDADPPNVDDVVESASEQEQANLLHSETIRWYGNADGSFLACIPGEARGTCGKSDFWRENGCGQLISDFRKTNEGWKQIDAIGVKCTCDPKVSR